jgi:alpha-1,2-mannosyltransferase
MEISARLLRLGAGVQRGSRELTPALALTLLAVLATLDLATEAVLRVDFKPYYLAGLAMSRGIDPYSVDALGTLARAQSIEGIVFPYLYPPALACWLAPLAELRPLAAQRIWSALSVLAVALAWVAMLAWLRASPPGNTRRRRGFLFVAGAGLFWVLPWRHNVAMGQVNALVLASIAASLWAFGRKRAVLAGLLLAPAIIVKVTPAVFVLAYAALGGWRALLGASAGTAALAASTLLLGAAPAWSSFLGRLPKMGHGSYIPGLYDPAIVHNFAPSGLVARLGYAPENVALLSQAGACLACAAAAFVAFQRRQHAPLALATFAPVMLLVSPITYVHHVIYLSPAVLCWADWAWRKQRHGTLAALLCLTALAGSDFPPWCERLAPALPWALVTSLNLYGVLGLYVLGLYAAWTEGAYRGGAKDQPAEIPAGVRDLAAGRLRTG